MTNDFIPFNKPLKLGSESNFIDEVLAHGVLAGNGVYTRKCHLFFEECFGFVSTFLTSSCSQALQIAASLCDLKDGDEVIVPSYGYVTTASSFNVNGARLVFADSEEKRPHICPIDIERKISSKTKVLVIIHYAGVACDMDRIMKLVDKHNLLLIEDCAQAINVTYDNKYLGSFGDFATFSFHETKNIHCGEGGLLVVNNSSKVEKARQIWQEGTNRYDFETGLTKKYEWVANGSSYQPSELNAAFLFGQLQKINRVTKERLEKWNLYSSSFKELEASQCLSYLTASKQNHNAHIFYLKLKNKKEREKLQDFLTQHKINSVFHYLPLHLSPYWLGQNKEISLKNAQKWSDCLLRIPMYNSLKTEEQFLIVDTVKQFFNK